MDGVSCLQSSLRLKSLPNKLTDWLKQLDNKLQNRIYICFLIRFGFKIEEQNGRNNERSKFRYLRKGKQFKVAIKKRRHTMQMTKIIRCTRFSFFIGQLQCIQAYHWSFVLYDVILYKALFATSYLTLIFIHSYHFNSFQIF